MIDFEPSRDAKGPVATAAAVGADRDPEEREGKMEAVPASDPGADAEDEFIAAEEAAAFSFIVAAALPAGDFLLAFFPPPSPSSSSKRETENDVVLVSLDEGGT